VDVPTGIEAVYGEYTIEEGPHALLAIRYPEAAAARNAEQAVAAWLSQGAGPDKADGAWRDIEAADGKHTLTYLSGNLLAIAPQAVAVDKMKGIMRELSSPPEAAPMLPPPVIYRG
jgi:hypothetical protein